MGLFRSRSEPSLSEQSYGLLRVRVVRGEDLVIRDLKSSDPYVVLKMGLQKVRTRVVPRNLNPFWNEELTLSVTDDVGPIHLAVFDHDTFSRDDEMGDAEIDVFPFVDTVKRLIESRHCLSNGTILRMIEPDRRNFLVETSSIKWDDGNFVQEMVLRLDNVARGEVELKLHWISFHGSKDLNLLPHLSSRATPRFLSCNEPSSSEQIYGRLCVRVIRGINLAIRDVLSSDPYVVLKMGEQVRLPVPLPTEQKHTHIRHRTKVAHRNLNPYWDEELTFTVIDDVGPIHLAVFDHDTFSRDDKMGNAKIDAFPFVETVKGLIESSHCLHDGIILRRIVPCRWSYLVEASSIKWDNDGFVQKMILRLRHVECGLVELELRWISSRFSKDLNLLRDLTDIGLH